MSTLDDLRLQAGRLLEACAAANALVNDSKAKPRRGRPHTAQGVAVYDPRLANPKGARH